MADYPFTTLEPVLGTLERDDRQLVLADIPGLIEGASAGAGLGHEFLAHVERCRLLVHVLDLQPLDGSDPVDNHATVEAELREHGHGLAEPAAHPLPVEGRPGAARAAREAAARSGERALDVRPVLATSAATGAGLDELARRDLRARAGREPAEEAAPSERRPRTASTGPGDGDAFTRRARGPGRVPGRAAGASSG